MKKSTFYCDLTNNLVTGWLQVIFLHKDSYSFPAKIKGGYFIGEIEVYSELLFIDDPICISSIDLNIRYLLEHSINPVVFYQKDYWDLLTLDFDINDVLVNYFESLDNVYQQFCQNKNLPFYTFVYNNMEKPDIEELKIVHAKLQGVFEDI